MLIGPTAIVVCNTLVTMSIIIIFITDVASAGMSSPLGPPLGRRSLGCRRRWVHHFVIIITGAVFTGKSLGCLYRWGAFT